MEVHTRLRWLGTLAVASALMLGVATAQQQLTLHDRVEVIDGPLNVRATPALSGDVAGSQETGAEGTVVDASPHYADGYWWWLVDFDQGSDGWVAEGQGSDRYLAKSSPSEAVQATPESTPTEQASPSAVEPPTVSEAESEAESEAQPGAETQAQTGAETQAGASRPQAFEGTWEGIVVSTRGSDDNPYPAELRLLSGANPGENIGSIAYPSSECGEYQLTVGVVRDSTMEVTRQGPENCSGTLQLTMTLSSESLEFLGSDAVSYALEEPHILLTYESGSYTYRGVLFRQDGGGLIRSQDLRRYDLFTQFAGEQDPMVFEGVQIRCGSQMYGDVPVTTTWTGDCVDGVIAGTGTLEVFQTDGIFRWAIDVTGSNGLKLVDGVITADLDANDFAFTCVKQSESGGYIWGQVSEEVALYYPRVADALLAVGASIYENDPCYTQKAAMIGAGVSVRIYLTHPAPSYSLDLQAVEGRMHDHRPRSTPKNGFASAVGSVHAQRWRAEREAAEEAAREARLAQERAAAQAEREAVRQRRQAFASRFGVTVMLDQGCDWTFNPYELEGATVGMLGTPREMLSATSASFVAHAFTTSPGLWVNTVVLSISWCDAEIIVVGVPRGTYSGSVLGLLAARVQEVEDGVIRLDYLGSHVCQEEDCEEFRIR